MQTRAIKQIRLSLALLVITALLVGAPALAAPQSASPAAPPASRLAAAPVAAPVLAAPVTIDLCAEASTSTSDGHLTMPDATVVPIWGFSNGAGDCADSLAIPSLPGPTLTVTQGDVVTVNVSNRLSENVSITFHGQGLPADTVGAPPNGTTSYTFTASQAGTFLYEAGLTANGAKQVAMGLYGALVVLPTSYTSEKVLVLSEIDPALNADPAGFNMQDYAPKYWLINGEAYPDTDDVLAPAGSTLLVRYVNAGLSEHSMGLLGIDQTVIAKDGHARPAFRAVSETLAAGQTMDTLITMPATVGARYPLYDTSRHLDNNGAADGGMMTFVEVGAASSDTVGPTTSGAAATPDPADGTGAVTITATVDDTATGGSTIASAEYFVGPTPGADGTGTAMSATDAAFNAVSEGVTGTLSAADVILLGNGTHTIHVHGRDSVGNWGPFNTYDLTITLADLAGPVTSGVLAAPDPADGTMDVTITATVDDTTTGGSALMAAEYFVGPTPGADGTGTAMSATDAVFDAVSEGVTGTLLAADVVALGSGTHTIHVHGQDTLGNWGGFATYTLTVSLPVPSIVVNTNADELNADGDCSLREAIQAANTNTVVDACDGTAADNIAFDLITNGAPITLTLTGAGNDNNATGDLDILASVTITGNGAANTLVNGNATDRVFHIPAGAGAITVSLSGMTIQNGSGGATGGGGLLNSDGATVNITDSTLSGNTAGVGGGGGVLNSGTGTVNITTSTLSGNSMTGGISGGGGLRTNGGTVTITDSTFSGNTVSGTSGGGGVLNVASSITINNSTFSGNSVSGALASGGGLSNFSGTSIITNSTFSGNSASGTGSVGGGLRRTSGAVTLTNTILANSTGANCSTLGGGSTGITNGGGNLVQTAGCGLPVGGATLGSLLGALASNGGPTETHALLAGSPAIDTGTGPGCPATDQRGTVRPVDGNGDTTAVCDGGSYEYP